MVVYDQICILIERNERWSRYNGISEAGSKLVNALWAPGSGLGRALGGLHREICSEFEPHMQIIHRYS